MRTNNRSRYAAVDEGGFTLVEILVVIIIIGILAAIAVPIYLNQRQVANDARLTADLRNVAAQVTMWSTSGASNEFAAAMRNDEKIDIAVIGEGGVVLPSRDEWNTIDKLNLPPVSISDMSVIEIAGGYADLGTGARPHETGEFCLMGTAQGSSYDYIPGSGKGAAFYDKYLFYDVKAGGVKTIDELVEATQAGQEISCFGHTNRYMSAHDIS